MPDVGLPTPGLGTWKNRGEQLIESILAAFDVGYRHVDTAQGYGNEKAVGEALKQVDVDREEYVVATKAHWEHLGYEEVLEGAEESLERLGIDYIDLFYIHWPAYNYDPHDTFAALAELVDRGDVRHVGVSNFTIELLEEALDASPVPIVANQIETHPYQQQDEMHEFLVQNDLYHVAYSPLARGNVFDIPEIVNIAEKYGASPPQISLAWLLQRENVVPIPMADTEQYVREDWEAQDIDLDEEDIEVIRNIPREEKYVDPDHAPWNDGEGSITPHNS